MRGPPPTPNVIRLLRGNPGKRPIKPEPKPEISETVPSPPRFLSGYARAEWRRVAPELHALGLLTVLDVMPFAAYCVAYECWRRAVEERAKAKADPARGLVVTGAISAAAGDMLKFAREFGMTPTARARIASAGYKPPSGGKFDGLLG
jgi:P27 family predicted phage terminase small subunit